MGIGDYVRTDKDEIGKVSSVMKENLGLGFGDIEACNTEPYVYGTIIKSSPRIIDLIQVGDVIRVFSDLHDLLGNELFEIRDEQHLKHLKNGFNEGYFHLISIVTKEMFEQMEYKVGE